MSRTSDRRQFDAGSAQVDVYTMEGTPQIRTPSAPRLNPYAPSRLIKGSITPQKWTAGNAALQVSHDGNAITIEPRKWPRLLHVVGLLVAYASFAVFFGFLPELVNALRPHGWVQTRSVTNWSFWTTVACVWTGIIAVAVLGMIICSQRKSHAEGAILRVDRVKALAEFHRVSWSLPLASIVAMQFIRPRVDHWLFPFARRGEATTPRCQLAIVYATTDGSIRRRLVYEHPSIFVQFKPLFETMRAQLPFPIEIHILDRTDSDDVGVRDQSADSTVVEEPIEVVRGSVQKPHTEH